MWKGVGNLSQSFNRSTQIGSVTHACTIITKMFIFKLPIVYEYDDTEGLEPDDEQSHEGVGEEDDGDSDDDETSDGESAGGQTDEDDDGLRRDWSDDDEPSW